MLSTIDDVDRFQLVLAMLLGLIQRIGMGRPSGSRVGVLLASHAYQHTNAQLEFQ
jgi:hypothetical protein